MHSHLRPHRSLPILTTLASAIGLALTACGSPSTPGVGNPSAPAGTTTSGSGASTAAPTQEVNPGGDIPDTQQYVAYDGKTYQITVPEGWSQASTPSGVTFSSHYNSVSIETKPAAQAPTVATARASEVPQLQRSQRNVSVQDISVVTRSAGRALLIRYEADSAPDPVTEKFARLAVERYEFWKGGSEVVVSLAAPVGADNVDPWRTITDSFQWR